MSQLLASINAWDVMTDVHVTARVIVRADDSEDNLYVILKRETTFPGVGEEDPREWLKDVLVGMLEAL